MAFLEKEDFCGLASEGVLECKSVTLGTSASVNETPNGKGEIIDEHVFGEINAPNCTYVIKSDWTANGIRLGKVVAVDGKKYALGSITISTSIGEPQISAAAVQVEDTAQEGGGEWLIPEFVVTALHEVQNILSCFTIVGDGNYEQSANYTISANIAPHTKDGYPVGHSSSLGKIVCQLTLTQIGETAPTVTPGEGWTITAPLALVNNDSAEPSWTCTLTYPLTKSAAA